MPHRFQHKKHNDPCLPSGKLLIFLRSRYALNIFQVRICKYACWDSNCEHKTQRSQNIRPDYFLLNKHYFSSFIEIIMDRPFVFKMNIKDTSLNLWML